MIRAAIVAIIALRHWLVDCLTDLACWLEPPLLVPTINGRQGLYCVFARKGVTLGYPDYVVLARRGGFTLGTLSYRNQWNAYSFKAHSEAVFNRVVLAEVYAMLKVLHEEGR